MLSRPKYITRSILKVSEVSKKMANLDFRVRYTEDRRDEIGILGENLNELSEKLESALDELKEKNTDLEKSIKLEQQLEQQQIPHACAVNCRAFPLVSDIYCNALENSFSIPPKLYCLFSCQWHETHENI